VWELDTERAKKRDSKRWSEQVRVRVRERKLQRGGREAEGKSERGKVGVYACMYIHPPRERERES